MTSSLNLGELLSLAISGDPLTLADLRHARKGAKQFAPDWMPFAHNTKGARVEIAFQGNRFKYRLNGYAPDGSDIR